MAQYTPNFNLYEPDSSDDFADFRTEFNNNMNIIDQNLGGGGSGGHTIYDKDGNALAQESGLQFTGAVNVTDDNVNGRTVVDVSGGSNLILDAQIYSTEEKQIGVWTDKKPLYRKTIFNVAPNTVLMSNVDTFVNAEVKYEGLSPDDYYKGFGDGFTVMSSFTFTETGGVITYVPWSSGTDYTNKTANYITIYYTKTTDVAGSGGYEAYGFSPVIYSDVERKIGVWRDNKPLYQRTIYIPSLPNATEVSYPHNISDLDRVVEIFGIAFNSSNYSIPIIFANPTYVSQVTAYTSATDIYIGTGMDRTSFVGYITLRYTKTTDVAGSGDYNTYGVPTVHYDTNEQVIGTWLGKPLYQKVFTGLSVVLGSDWVNAIDISSMYMENCILGIGIVSNTYQTPLCTRINGNYLQAYMNGMGGVTITTIVIQYTKTTDT